MTWVPSSPHDGDPEGVDPRRVEESLDRVTRSLGLPGARALNRVFAHWVDAVGEHVAAHATPISLRAGRLVVGVDQPGWATQLRYLEADLLARLEGVAGERIVTAIDVRVRPA
jgi:predicted nucleic acid-binding Zn ribbon protein